MRRNSVTIHSQHSSIIILWPGIAHAMALGLGPWMAVEIPDLIEKGVITYKEKAPASAS
jgi:hypothetical protein